MALTDLADVVRRAGLQVVEVDGWRTRWRGGGDYRPGRPVAVMVHHTASKTSAHADVHYMTYGSNVAPIANLYLARDAAVWVMAAGPTNTNGKGGPLGSVPADSMNTHAIGIEMGNSGTGEPYPEAQQDAALQLVRALQAAYGIEEVYSHAEWSPGRKIDPAGPSRWAPGGGTWDMDAFRRDLDLDPAPHPDPEGDDAVLVNIVKEKGGAFVYKQFSNGTKTWIPDPETLKLEEALSGMSVQEMPDRAWMAATGVIVGPIPPGVDRWGRTKA